MICGKIRKTCLEFGLGQTLATAGNPFKPLACGQTGCGLHYRPLPHAVNEQIGLGVREE